MTNQEIKSYKEMGIPVAKKRKIAKSITLMELVEYGLIFLLTKIYLFNALSPFGVSYFASIFPKQKRGVVISSAFLGILAAGMGIVSLKYAGALVITCAFCVLMEKELSKRPWLYGIVAAGAVTLTGMVFVIFNGFIVYDFLLQIFESLLVFLSYFAFETATEVLHGSKERKIFEPAESLSLVVLCSGVVMSLQMIPYFQSVAHTLSMVIIFVAGLAGGFPLSCATGITLGIVNSVTEAAPAAVVAIYGVSALCSGLLQKKGRWGVIIGFFVTNSFAVAYFSGISGTVITFSCIVAAGILLFLIPDRFLSMFGEVIKAPGYQEDSVMRIREIMEDKLTEVSDSFTELSVIFNNAVESRIDSEVRNPGYLFDKTAEQICRGCSLMNFCWQKEYSETRHALLTLYNRMEMRGRGVLEDVPESFKRECIRLDEFLETLNKNYDVHKVNLLWAGRVAESRGLVAEQFKNVSSVLEHLKKELVCEPSEAIRLERKIAASLDRHGFTASQVRVSSGDGLEVTMVMENCEGERICAGKVAAIISHAVGLPMLKIPSPCSRESCRLKFQAKPRFSMETGFAQVAGRNGTQNGDHLMSTLSADGRYILALSDGMGSGDNAEAQSSMTIHLIRRLLASGFDKETALRIINSMLLVSTEQESFATADLCLVNLYSGALEFIKIGAVNSYVKRGDGVEKIGCTSLPAGIVSELDPDRDLRYAKTGDYVVMVTDGVTDVLDCGMTGRLFHLVENYEGDSPQRLADEILKNAIAASGGIPKDDMTVLVAKLIEA